MSQSYWHRGIGFRRLGLHGHIIPDRGHAEQGILGGRVAMANEICKRTKCLAATPHQPGPQGRAPHKNHEKQCWQDDEDFGKHRRIIAA